MANWVLGSSGKRLKENDHLEILVKERRFWSLTEHIMRQSSCSCKLYVLWGVEIPPYVLSLRSNFTLHSPPPNLQKFYMNLTNVFSVAGATKILKECGMP